MALADCKTPLEADTGALLVLDSRLPHLSYETNQGHNAMLMRCICSIVTAAT